MQAYVAKRILLVVPTLLLLSLIVFGIMRVVPGDPAKMFLVSSDLEETYTLEDVERVRKRLGIDKLIYVQYVNLYMSSTSNG